MTRTAVAAAMRRSHAARTSMRHCEAQRGRCDDGDATTAMRRGRRWRGQCGARRRQGVGGQGEGAKRAMRQGRCDEQGCGSGGDGALARDERGGGGEGILYAALRGRDEWRAMRRGRRSRRWWGAYMRQNIGGEHLHFMRQRPNIACKTHGTTCVTTPTNASAGKNTPE